VKVLRILTVVVVSALASSASGQTVTTIYSFTGNASDGGCPHNALFQDPDGYLYGTAPGVYIQATTNNYGAIYRIGTDGSFTNLHSFGGGDGAYPLAGLTRGKDGAFYGTTYQGGSTNGHYKGRQWGTVFRIDPSGSLTTLYSFAGVPDGGLPAATLAQADNGCFYGTTLEGGNTNFGNGFGNGTVFRIDSNGNYTNLYSFRGSSNGGYTPYGRLVQGTDGNLYGTTQSGGGHGGGTVFRISPNGNYTNLYSFLSFSGDGQLPTEGLVQCGDGNFYGMTESGGTYVHGTVFRISPAGNYTNIYSFKGPPNDGSLPFSWLVLGSDGNFYGTTESGGTYNTGTIFRISSSGSYSNLYSFAGPPKEGEQTGAGLIQGSDGCFYGVTAFGGTHDSGTVYRLSIPLGPPANQISSIQPAGNDLTVSIPSVAGETY
jgi:uncharacterized repeat protein (TIGR03803 family)